MAGGSPLTSGSSNSTTGPNPTLNGAAQSSSTSNPVLLQNPYGNLMGQSINTSQGQYGNLLKAIQGVGNQNFGTGGYYQQAANQLAQTGKSAEQQLAQQNQLEMGQANQNALNRGLGNSTVSQAMQNAVQNNTNMASTNLQSQLAGQQANLLQGEAGANLNYGNLLGSAIQSPLATGASPMLDYLANLIGAQKAESSSSSQNAAYEPTAPTGLAPNFV